MEMYKHIQEHGYLRTDFLVRKNALKIVYKGNRVFVYPR